MSKYTAEYTNEYKGNRRAVIERGYDTTKLDDTIDILLQGEPVPARYKDHALKGNWSGYRECHVDGMGDWLLVYKKHEGTLILLFTGTGTHSDLFD
ncbi:MAG: type II toxin-antitoxin system YafQ family toxin [Defluviitaleaceae bacterium]|nr:type II toxin-antitoxin system YafQ family toxin [Defluviitaleaceae bacterium]